MEAQRLRRSIHEDGSGGGRKGGVEEDMGEEGDNEEGGGWSEEEGPYFKRHLCAVARRAWRGRVACSPACVGPWSVGCVVC